MERTLAGSALSPQPAGVDYQPQGSGAVARLSGRGTGNSICGNVRLVLAALPQHSEESLWLSGRDPYELLRLRLRSPEAQPREEERLSGR